MEYKKSFSSSQVINTTSEISHTDDKKQYNIRKLTAKSELVHIKKEPNLSDHSEVENYYNIDQLGIKNEIKKINKPCTQIQTPHDNLESKNTTSEIPHTDDKKQYNIGELTVKSELVHIKKEPNLSDHSEVENYYNIDQLSIENEIKNKNQPCTQIQTPRDNLESKNEPLTLNNYSGLWNSETDNAYDIKQEIEHDSFLEIMKQSENLDENVDNSLENDAECMEPKIQDLGMFGFTCPDEVYKCKYCNFETKHKNQLWGHMQIHNDSLELKNQEVTLYKCPFFSCQFQTVYKYSITKHFNTHKTQKYKCSKCSYVTLQPKKYEQHVKSCEKVQTLLQCDQCDFKVKTQGLLLVHKRKHKKESELLKCPECDLTTMYASALKKHIEKHRREETMDNLFTCTKCSYRSPSKTVLMRHERVHGKEDEGGEGKYQCSDCSFQTMNLEQLENHMVEHKGEKVGDVGTVEGTSKTFFCSECSFKTTVFSKINHHKNLHVRQKNGEIYKCNHCNYETMYKYLLKRHSLKHKDTDQIQTYPCDLCGYRAKLKDYLVRHKRTHMKKQLQQYKCTVCLFETIYKHTFKEHLARHNISLVDVKKFLSDKSDVSEADNNMFVSEEVVDIQNITGQVRPIDGTAKQDSEVI